MGTHLDLVGHNLDAAFNHVLHMLRIKVAETEVLHSVIFL